MEPIEYDAMYQAEDRHWWYRGLRAILAALQRQFSPSEAELALDIGCGTGGMLRHAGLGREAVGIEASPRALRCCGQDRLGLLVRGSANLLPFRSGSFDRAFSFDVFCHQSVRPLQALREARRVMKRGAAFFANLPAHNILRAHHDEAVHTAHRFTHGEVARLLRRAGLAPERVTYWNFILFPLELAYRILDKSLMPGGRDQSEVNLRLPMVDAVLFAVVRLEAWLLTWIDLPVGLSVFSVARRTR